jgi:hypothetical protein
MAGWPNIRSGGSDAVAGEAPVHGSFNIGTPANALVTTLPRTGVEGPPFAARDQCGVGSSRLSTGASSR